MYQTVQSVFDIAIHLMDAQNESTGSTNTADTQEYQFRTPSLLNSILDRVYKASDTFFVAEAGRRPICPKVSAMSDGNPLLKVIYFQAVDALTMQEVATWEQSERVQGCIAVQAGEIRLIDNVRIK